MRRTSTIPVSAPIALPLAPRVLRRAAPIAAAAGLLGALVLALLAPRVVEAQRGGGVPPGHRPPAGLCRVWYDRVPPGRQPAPTDCASARAEAWRTGARVIVGEGGWRDDGWWERGTRRDGPWWERVRRDGRRDERRDGRWDDRRDRDDDGWWEGRRRDRDDDARWERRRRDRDDDRWERDERRRRDRDPRRRGDGWWW